MSRMRSGETVVAVVVSEGDSIDETELIDYARARIAHFKCPRRVVFVEELPYTATGKILKRKLRERITGVAASVHR